MSNHGLSNNSLAFIALCNEYCSAIEQASTAEPTEFTANMIRLLPRLYITANDLKTEEPIENEGYIDQVLDEESYETVRRNLETVFGADDTYLEVFEEDMKYSETPIATSVSEGLADIFQSLYNFVEMVREAIPENIPGAIAAMKEDFNNYWSQILCNVMRPLNNIYHNPEEI
ncbi:MAG: DUF5063 domain-containing protein [Paramuribaculum sp.]|nr:DUF5063 domain-containing protein [Paramuribaculum sp.]